MKHMIFGALFLVMPLPLLAAESEYPMTDVCRATLNDMLNRDLSIMNATQIEDGSVRVQYTRPQDGKLFSYRCRSPDGSTIGILDENISGPRWYGELPDDIQRSYRIKDGKLIIRSFSPLSETSSEKLYSHIELSASSDGNTKDENSEILKKYGIRLQNKTSDGKLQFRKVSHTMTKPLNSYLMNFETSVKAYVTPPAEEVDTAIEKSNARIQLAWDKSFCTTELKKIMNENQIDNIDALLVSKGVDQALSVCFK